MIARHGRYRRRRNRFGYSFGNFRAGEREWGIQSWRDRRLSDIAFARTKGGAA